MNEYTLAPNTSCYQDVLERLSHRLARLLSEVDIYQQQQQQQQQQQEESEAEKAKKKCVNTNSVPMTTSSTVSTLSWPSLQVHHRVSRLQESLGECKELWETMQRLDAAMRQLKTESLIDLRNISGPCTEGPLLDVEEEEEDKDKDSGNMNSEEGRRKNYRYYYHMKEGIDMLGRNCLYNSGKSDKEETTRLLVKLQRQKILHGDEVRQLSQRAVQIHDTLNSHFNKTPNLCEEVFNAISDSQNNENEHDMAKLHALCRRNEERARSLQERLTRILEKYHRVVAHTNMELCRLDLELQAIERQSPQTEEENMLQLLHYRGDKC
ncbi:putative actin-like protein [Trypanosoma theileri]|uniref:Putative actin-like protein n=1 Tax=Trypanosoma theileri TaxID=67003 RepID=A0A1X0NYK0_9TRYP|nr:putative actin-like protein [Trypanosoma theileri]ORC89628.1 putative actin-like protein [Trypanosoma theileri]